MPILPYSRKSTTWELHSCTLVCMCELIYAYCHDVKSRLELIKDNRDLINVDAGYGRLLIMIITSYTRMSV